MITRHSSRENFLDESFLNQKLQNAQGYDRIAGYFRSSIFEVAGETLDSVTGCIRVICNSDLDALDVRTAKAAQEAMRKSWCAGQPELLSDVNRERFHKLYDYLISGKLQEAQRKIRSIPKRHPFDERYSQVTNIDWDSCSKVLDAGGRRKLLMGDWLVRESIFCDLLPTPYLALVVFLCDSCKAIKN